MIKKIYKFIIAGLSVFILSCPVIFTASAARWEFGKPVAVAGIGVYGTKERQEDNLIRTITKAINRVLALLSFVCLCLTLYAGFLILTSGGDSKKYEKGFGIIKNAGIGLAIIALSWLIVSLIFYVINSSVVTET